MTKKILLALGDVCNRLHKYINIINAYDELLVAPNQAIIRRVKFPALKVSKIELMDISLGGEELEKALNILKEVTGELKNAVNDDESYPWKYRANHFSINLRENSLSIVALEKYLNNNRGFNIYMLVESKKYITSDYWQQFSDEENNILQHYVREYCEINCVNIQEVNLKGKILNSYEVKRAIKDLIYPNIILLYRLYLIIWPAFFLKKNNKTHENFNKKTILFYSRSITHFRSYRKLIDKYKNEYNIILLIHGYKISIKDMPDALTVVNLSRYFRLNKLIKLINKNKLNNNNINNKSFWSNYIMEYFNRVYKLEGYGAFYKEILEEAIVDLKPNVIVASDEPGGHMQEIYSIAKSRGISTVRVQHGELSEAEVIAFHTNISANLCLVQIGGAKNLLEKYNDEKVKVNELNLFHREDKINIDGRVQKNFNKILICGTSLGEKSSFEIVAEIYQNLKLNVSSYKLFYRPHPTENIDFFEKEFKKNNIEIEVEYVGFEVEEYLISFDLCIVILSSIGSEIASRGVPVFYYSFQRWIGASYNDVAFNVFSDLKDLCESVIRFTQDYKFRCNVIKNVQDYVVKCFSKSQLTIDIL